MGVVVGSGYFRNTKRLLENGFEFEYPKSFQCKSITLCVSFLLVRSALKFIRHAAKKIKTLIDTPYNDKYSLMTSLC